MRATCAGLGAIPRDGVASVAIEPRGDHRASSLLSIHDALRASVSERAMLASVQ